MSGAKKKTPRPRRAPRRATYEYWYACEARNDAVETFVAARRLRGARLGEAPVTSLGARHIHMGTDDSARATTRSPFLPRVTLNRVRRRVRRARVPPFHCAKKVGHCRKSSP